MIQALIFDFDGLIIETEKPIYQSWQEIYQSYGCELPFSSWLTIIGTANNYFDPFAELARQLGTRVDHEAIELLRKPREMALTNAQPVLPGVLDYLGQGRRLALKLGIASSSNRNWVEEHLSRRGLRPWFDCVRVKEDVQSTKPAPDLYLSVLEALGLRGNQAIALEDSPHGVQAAKAAGLFCVAVPTEMTRSLSFDGADVLLNSLADLPLDRLIARLEANARAQEC
jgi:HAD superfamily hydrolase (TIGR01509 family)